MSGGKHAVAARVPTGDAPERATKNPDLGAVGEMQMGTSGVSHRPSV